MSMCKTKLDIVTCTLVFGFSAVFASNVTLAATSLTLNEVLKTTLSNAQPVTSARATISNAEAQHLGAIAAFLPTLSIGDQDQYFRPLQGATSTLLGGTLVQVNQPIYNNVMTANLGLNLYNGGKDIANLRGSQESLSSAATGLRAALDSTFDQVLSDVDALAIDQATVASQQRIVDLNKEIERLTALRMTGQASSRIDLIQAQQQTLAAQTQLSQSRQREMSDRVQLANVMGYLAASSDWQVDDRLPQAPTVATGKYPVEQDPAVQSAYSQVQAARQQVNVAKAAYMPTLSLTGQYNQLGTSSSTMDQALMGSRGNNYVMGISMSLPLLPFYNTVSAVDIAHASVETNLSNYQNALATASSRAQSALQQLQEAQQGAQLATASAKLARDNVGLTEERYHANQSSLIDLNRARVLAEQADLSVTATELALRLTEWKLYRVANPLLFADALMSASAKLAPLNSGLNY